MDVFDLVAKISLDTSEYEKGLKDAKRQMSDIGSETEKAGGKFSKIGGILGQTGGKFSQLFSSASAGFSKLKDGVSSFGTIFKANIASDAVSKGFDAIVSGTKKAGEGLIGLVKDASSAYGEYQQMVGGVEKLYGKSAKTIVQYAQNAYATSGMSANKYMDTATQFSASLIKSLKGNTKEAAEQTDVAMKAISDNVNVFGSNMEDVTNAFKGFSKQNYTMLDNLKLGYGGTKTEMQNLIKDANEYAKSIGKAGNLSIDSFSDIVSAIELIQEKQGIAGTTAKEAMTTLQGTANMTKMAWENVKTAIGGGGDLDKAVDNLITAIVGNGEKGTGLIAQWVPTIEKALDGIGQLVSKSAPLITKYLPGLISSIVPTLLKAVGTLFASIAEALPQLFNSLKEAVSSSMTGILSPDSIISGISKTISEILTAVSAILPSIIEIAAHVIEGLIQGITQAAPQIIQAVVNAVNALVNALPGILQVIVNAIPVILPALINGITQLVQNIAQQLPSIIKVIVDAIPALVQSILQALESNGPQIIQAIADMLPTIITGLMQLAADIVVALPQIIAVIIQAIPQIVQSIKKAFTDPQNQAAMKAAGKQLLKALGSGFEALKDWIFKKVKAIGSGIVKNIKGGWKGITKAGGDLVRGLWNGIADKVGWILGKIKGFGKQVLDGLKNFFKIKSPSRVMRDEVGVYLSEGVAEGITKGEAKAVRASEKLASEVVKGAKGTIAKVTKASDSLADAIIDSVSTTKTSGSGKKKKTVKLSLDEYSDAVIKAADKKIKTLKKANKMSSKEEASFWTSLAKKAKVGSTAYSTMLANATTAMGNSQKERLEKAKSSLQAYQNLHDTSAKFEANYWKKILSTMKKGTKEYNEVQKLQKSAETKVLDERLQKYHDFVDNYAVYHNGLEMTTQQLVDYWGNAAASFKKGSDQWVEAEKEYLTQKKALDEGIQNANDALISSIQEAEKKYSDALDSIEQEIKQKGESLRQSLGEWYAMFDAGDPVSVDALWNAANSQVSAQEEGDKLLEQIGAVIGKDSPFYTTIEEMGYTNGLAYWRALASMPDDELKRFNDVQNQLVETSKKTAESILQPQIDKEKKEAYTSYIEDMGKAWETYQKTIKDLGKDVTSFTSEFNKSLNDVSTKYVQSLTGSNGMVHTTQSALNDMESIVMKKAPIIADKMRSSGSDMMDSFIAGMKSKYGELKSALEEIAQAIVDNIGFSEPKVGPLSRFHTFAPDMMDLFSEGIRENGDKISDAFDDTLALNQPTEFGAFTSTYSGNQSGIGEVVKLLREYLPVLGNQQIVLDDGAIVGKTVNRMNEQLAYVNNRRAGAFA